MTRSLHSLVVSTLVVSLTTSQVLFAEIVTRVDASKLRIAFGSCAQQDTPQPIWSAISAAKPDLFVFLGDNVYADSASKEVINAAYQKLARVEGFSKLRSHVPIIGTWDDHDYGVNDGGAEFIAKEISKQEFLKFFRIPKHSPVRARPGVYNSYVLGQKGSEVRILLLDTRTFRSPLLRAKDPSGVTRYAPNPDPSATILGEAQWRWLEEELRKPAALRIIGSSIQFAAVEHPLEKWANFPQERSRLLELVRRTEASNVVVISGDKHFAELSVDPTAGPYPLYDLTSSSLTSSRGITYERNSLRIGERVHEANFGVLDIDLTRGALGMRIANVRGETVLEHEVALTQLSAKK